MDFTIELDVCSFDQPFEEVTYQKTQKGMLIMVLLVRETPSPLTFLSDIGRTKNQA